MTKKFDFLQFCALLGAAIIFSLTLISTHAPAQAQAPAPEGDRPMAGLVNGEDYYALPLPDTAFLKAQPAMAAPGAVSSRIPTSKVVFDTYRDGNYEIYIANDDNGELKRLTNLSKIDIQPRINRSFTKIVFASNRDGKYEIFTMNMDGSGVSRLTINTTDDVNPVWSPDGSKIAFEAYRDGHGEVYVMNANGSGQTRLTVSDAFDGEPSWSPDGAKIAFTAYRAGQWRVWVMQADGSGQVQLSQEPYSGKPVWSRDGGTIAYAADSSGDGWSELWKMSADGSARMAHPNTFVGQYNFIPQSWSPDWDWVAATETHWILYNGNWYWDSSWLNLFKSTFGQNEKQGLMGSSYDWDPDWECPDYTAPASSMQALPAQSPGPFTVSWSGNDPGGSGIGGYFVQVKDGVSGSWVDWKYNTLESSGSYPGVGGHTYYFRVRATDVVHNAEAYRPGYDAVTTVEAQPPVSRLDPLPSYSLSTRGGPITITWGGNDPGGSGIKGYDIQYRHSLSDSWTDWLINTQVTSAEFPSSLGEFLYFQIRAVDQASNQEAWHSSWSGYSTAVCSFRISGSVVDNTGLPIKDVITGTDPSALVSPPSQEDGSYDTCAAAETAQISTNWQKSEYGSLPPTIFTVPGQAKLDPILPPLNNVIVNPSAEFESSITAPWSAGGVAMPVASPNFYTGSGSVRLGEPLSLTLSADISSIPGGYYPPKLVADAGGNLHAAWFLPAAIYYARKDNGSAWSSPYKVAEDPAQGHLVSDSQNLAVGSDGTVHAVWSQITQNGGWEYSLVYSQRSPAGVWSPPQVFTPKTLDVQFNIDLVVDSQGTLHIGWGQASALWYINRTSAGAWSASMKVFDAYYASNYPAVLEIDASGVLHAILFSYKQINYRQRNPGGAWGGVEVVTFPVSGPPVVDIKVSSAGYVSVVYAQINGAADDIFYFRRSPGGAWSAPLNISNTETNSVAPRMALGNDGSVHVTWTEIIPIDMISGYSLLRYRKMASNGSWLPTEAVTSPDHLSIKPLISVDNLGVPHIAWAENVGYMDTRLAYARKTSGWITTISQFGIGSQSNPQILFDGAQTPHVIVYSTDLDDFTPSRVLTSGDSYLSQTVTIPAQMVNPVLSFVYQAEELSDSSGSYFGVEVQEGTNVTTLLRATPPEPVWSHRWFDLTPWVGKQISVRFFVHLTAGKAPGIAYVDDITIGSAGPDLWVASPIFPSAMPGRQVEQLLQYGNQGFFPAGGTILEVTLPEKLNYVSAVPAPDTVIGKVLTWNLSALPARSGPVQIHLTIALAADATLWSTLVTNVRIQPVVNEMHTANNTRQFQVLVGKRIYLGIVHKAD